MQFATSEVLFSRAIDHNSDLYLDVYEVYEVALRLGAGGDLHTNPYLTPGVRTEPNKIHVGCYANTFCDVRYDIINSVKVCSAIVIGNRTRRGMFNHHHDVRCCTTRRPSRDI